MNLIVAGIDLRLANDDKWYCFEINSSPGFIFYQHATGDRIDESIAHHLLALSE